MSYDSRSMFKRLLVTLLLVELSTCNVECSPDENGNISCDSSSNPWTTSLILSVVSLIFGFIAILSAIFAYWRRRQKKRHTPPPIQTQFIIEPNQMNHGAMDDDTIYRKSLDMAERAQSAGLTIPPRGHVIPNPRIRVVPQTTYGAPTNMVTKSAGPTTLSFVTPANEPPSPTQYPFQGYSNVNLGSAKT